MLSHYTVYTGGIFNEICKDKTFYKFLNDNLIHYDFEYALGLNTDIIKFNPIRECSEGGLYFCEESEAYRFWESCGTKVAIVKIPDDALVYIEQYKFKADKIILTDIMDFDEAPDKLWISIFDEEKDINVFKYIRNQTPDMCNIVVNGFGENLQYVNNQTEELCTLAIKQDGLNLDYVDDKFITDELCTSAVQNNGLALQYVPSKLKTHEICSLAIRQKGWAIEFVEKQTEELCRLAILSDNKPSAFMHIKTRYQTEELCKLAVQMDGLNLDYVKNQTPEICTLVVQQNGLALQYVKNQTLDICTLALKQNSNALMYINLFPNLKYLIIMIAIFLYFAFW